MGTIAKSWLALKWKKKWYFTFFHQACTEPVESLSRHRDAVLRLKKKLEAPRQGFYNDVFATQGVGCVCVCYYHRRTRATREGKIMEHLRPGRK